MWATCYSPKCLPLFLLKHALLTVFESSVKLLSNCGASREKADTQRYKTNHFIGLLLSTCHLGVNVNKHPQA